MLAVIGGSGVYDIGGLANKRWVKVESAFGAPSDELLFAELNGQPLAFLPRHGRGHQIPPSEINFHANSMRRSPFSLMLTRALPPRSAAGSASASA